MIITATDTLYAHSAGLESCSKQCHTLLNRVMSPKSLNDIGDINSPTHAGSRPTRVDPKLFGKPSDFSGDRREWRHFEWVFRNWFGFLYDTAEEWLDQAASAPGELGEAVPDRRETDKALYMSLAMVCKNEALDLVKTVTHKRGFESWRKLSKEYGATTGTSLHEYTNLLECDFGTTTVVVGKSDC